MPRRFIRQDAQIRKSVTYGDTVAPSLANFQTNPINIEDDLNSIRSQLHNFLDVQSSAWYTDLVTPSALETGTKRGINNLNEALHLLEKKRVLRDVYKLVAVSVPGGQNYVVLGTGELPTQLTAAVGSVPTLGTVVAAHDGTFGTHSLAEVVNTASVLNPLNRMVIVEASSRDPILSDDRVVYGLFQSENGTDGHTISDTTPSRVQISFVRMNATGTDLEAVPVADIENQSIAYSTRERVRLEDLDEADFLSGAIVDVGGGGSGTPTQKTFVVVTSTTAKNTDVGGVGGGANLDSQIHDLSGGNFIVDHDVYYNGQLQRGGADATADFDYYPGTSLSNGQLRFEYNVKRNATLAVISRA